MDPPFSKATSGAHTDINIYTSSVLDHINITTVKHMKDFSNQKPWMNSEVHHLLKARDAAFKSSDAQDYSRARANLKRGNRKAKHAHELLIEEHFHSISDPKHMWKRLQTIIDHKPTIQSLPTSNAFLNHFLLASTKASYITPQMLTLLRVNIKVKFPLQEAKCCSDLSTVVSSTWISLSEHIAVSARSPVMPSFSSYYPGFHCTEAVITLFGLLFRFLHAQFYGFHVISIDKAVFCQLRSGQDELVGWREISRPMLLLFGLQPCTEGGIGGSVVGCSPVMRKARVQFPANTSTPATGYSAGPKPGKNEGHGGLVVSTFASHLQGWGFDSRLRRVRVCSPCLGGFLPQSKDMHENLNIFSSATSSSDSCLFLSDTVSKPYSMAGLTTVLYTFPLILADIFLPNSRHLSPPIPTCLHSLLHLFPTVSITLDC
ncbi:hypothetical protein QTP70_000118 [Hemibagrus guttatus]|uniref:Uncharacterized protein n=1 Tax=Hemibagrus guttatus TaxID=175788 RepID=A0AAE0V0Z3_9TELE|nr:hypothetical protein QTP70_000118 [Hemibagrus guttatus]